MSAHAGAGDLEELPPAAILARLRAALVVVDEALEELDAALDDGAALADALELALLTEAGPELRGD